jgi:hypothetical protein
LVTGVAAVGGHEHNKMSVAKPQSAVPNPKRRGYGPMPGHFLLALLAIEGFLWSSERFSWSPFNQYKGYAVLAALATVVAAMLLMLLWLAVALLFRWRFQFSLRSLLVLVVVVAVPCSWLEAEMNETRKQQRAVEVITATPGGSVSYDYEFNSIGKWIKGATPGGPKLLRWLLGEDFFNRVVEIQVARDAASEQAKTLTDVRCVRVCCSGQVTDATLVYLRGLPQLRVLHFGANNVTDAGLASLTGLTHLERLEMRYMRITDAGLKHLEGLPQLRALWLGAGITDAGLERLKRFAQLEELSLFESKVTDAGLEHLKELTMLHKLCLDYTPVTDAGLEHLKGLTQLQILLLLDTGVTDEGVNRLKQALPNCEIGRHRAVF